MNQADTALQAMNAVRNTIDGLRAENTKLQNCIEDHIKELAAERKFRDEFELWLEPDAELHIRYQWHAMKREYLEVTKESDDDGNKIS